MTRNRIVTALAPRPEPLDPEWSEPTLREILATERTPRRRAMRRGVVVGVVAGVLSLGTATALAVGGPTDVVKRVLTEFGRQPNTTGNDIGELHDPQLVAQFRTETGGLFAFWVARSSKGAVCLAISDGAWDGEGSPTEEELSTYGCGGDLWVGPGLPPEELTRPDQLGGFFKDNDGPLVYGISPYPDTTSVRVEGRGVDRTLPVRSDSLGFGAALPEAGGARSLRLTFLDEEGRVLGSKEVIAPVG